MPARHLAAQRPVALPSAPAEASVDPIDLDAVAAAAKLLGAAERPLIVVGGGRARCRRRRWRRVAEMLQAPVVAHHMGRGALDSRNPLSVSSYLGHRLWGEADVVLAVGTRLSLQQRLWGTDDALKIVRIDADPDEIDRIARPAVGIVGDARACCGLLIDALPRHNRTGPRAPMICARARPRPMRARPKFAPQVSYLEAIRAELPEDGIFVDEVTQIGYVGRLAFPVYRPRTYLTPGYQGTLGWGVATAHRREGGAARYAARRHFRRRRLHVQRAGAGDGGAAPHPRRHRAHNDNAYRQCPPLPGRSVRQPGDRQRSQESRIS